MRKIAKKRNAAFKAKVAIEAIRGERIIAALSAQYWVHSSAMHKWKKVVLEKVASVFEEGAVKSNDEVIFRLYKKICRLEVEELVAGLSSVIMKGCTKRAITRPQRRSALLVL